MSQPLSTSQRTIRLGIIGTGLAVKKLHWPALVRMPDRFVVVAFANRTRATAEEFAALAQLPMDGYTPDYHDPAPAGRRRGGAGVRADPAASAHRAGIASRRASTSSARSRPGVDLAEARQFLALVDQHPRQKFMMTENFFYRDDLRLARSLVDEGAIGRPQLLLEKWVHQLVPTPGDYSITPWRYKPEYRGGPLQDGGVHSIATIRLLGGDITQSLRPHRVGQQDDGRPERDGDDLRLAPAARPATASGASSATPCSTRCGTRGSTAARGRSSPRGGRCGSSVPTARSRSIGSSRFDTGHYNMFLNFHDAVMHDEPIVATVRQSFENMLVVLQALDSAAAGPAGRRGRRRRASGDGWGAPLATPWRARAVRRTGLCNPTDSIGTGLILSGASRRLWAAAGAVETAVRPSGVQTRRGLCGDVGGAGTALAEPH